MNKTVLSILICAMAVSACKEKSSSRNAAAEQKGAEIVTDKTVSGSGTQRNATLNRYQANSANGNNSGNGSGNTANGGNRGNSDGNTARSGNNNTSRSQNQSAGTDGNDMKTVNLKEADGDVPSYGRGFYRYGKDPSQITDADLENAYRDGYRLMYMPADLSRWRNQDLPQSYLAALDAGLSKMKNVNAILRFSYDYTKAGQDTNLAQLKRHIEQLRPILAKNRDNIFVWQAGFIGAWGEWHSSANRLDSNQNKAEVFKALLNANNNGIYAKLQLRYPNDLMNFQANSHLPYGAVSTGLHNDCFMAGTDDVGTYFPRDGRSTDVLRRFARNNSASQIFGGETCTPQSGARTSCTDILKEGAEYHLSYLNYDYSKAFINSWEAGACMGEVRKRMGYRYVVESLSGYVDKQDRNVVHWFVKIHNKGWADAPNWGYKLYLVVNGKKMPVSNRFIVQPDDTQIFSGSFNKNQISGAPILVIDTEDADYAGPHTLQFANADDNNVQKVTDSRFGNGLALKWLLTL